MPQIPWGAPGVKGPAGFNAKTSPYYKGPKTTAADVPNFLQHLLPGAQQQQQNVLFPDLYVTSPGYDYSAQIRAMYDQLRSKGQGIYDKTKGTLTDIYGDLRSAYAPAEENTRIRFNTAVDTTAAAKASGDAASALRSSAEDAARRDMLAKMGIANQGDTGSGGASVDLAREEGAANREGLQSNWAGLMSSLSASQQGRDASALRGVGDQQTMALEELATRWSDYQNELAQRQAQAMQGARGGGGRTLNPIYAQMASSNPMIAMLAQQQFSNQTGMSPDQISAIMNPKKQDGMSGGQLDWYFNAMADAGGMGKGGIEGFLANRAKSTNVSSTDWWNTMQQR